MEQLAKESFGYTVTFTKGFDETVEAIETKVRCLGDVVFHVHEASAHVEGKGFRNERIKVFTICRCAEKNRMSDEEIRRTGRIWCPLLVYGEHRTTYVSVLNPNVVPRSVPESEIRTLTDEVDRMILALVEESGKEEEQTRDNHPMEWFRSL